jgi:hypothetical protein
MFEINGYSVEWIKDPFGIIPGKRYEFLLDIAVDEEDEMYAAEGISLRLIYRVDESGEGIVKYEFQEQGTGKYLDFEMDEDELIETEGFCKAHYGEAE